MAREDRGSRILHASTIVCWFLAVVLAMAGMALDGRGEFTLSLVCFLAASVALVAPLVNRRRRESTGRNGSTGSDSTPAN